MVYWRMPSYNATRVGLGLALGLVFGALYYQQGKLSDPTSVAQLQSVMGMIYTAVAFMGEEESACVDGASASREEGW